MNVPILALTALTLAGAAQASPCGDKIASLQSRYDAASPPGEAAAATVAAGAETTAAKLHHQPAPASDADANAAADSPASRRSAKFKVAIEEARAADHAGDVATCEVSVARAETALSP